MDDILGFLHNIEYEKRYSKHTIISYENDLNQFRLFCVENYTEPKRANSTIIRSWVVSLFESHSKRTIQRKLSALKSFYKYLHHQGIISQNPMVKVLYPKSNKSLPEFLDRQAMQFLFDKQMVFEGFSGYRDQFIVKVFYFTGIRLSELIHMKDVDINKAAGTIKVLGKRNKERIIPVSRQFLEECENYISLRNQEFGPLDHPYFFTTNTGNKTYPKFVYRVVSNYLNLVTTKTKKSPHILRHTFATHLLNQGAELSAIKELLGHANLSATQVYTHTTFEKLKSIYKQAHPRA